MKSNWAAERKYYLLGAVRMYETTRFAACVIVATFSAGLTQAALYDRGDGLVYDSVLNITWLQNANYSGSLMHWNEAEAWASSLTYAGITGWRLPDLAPVAGGQSFN